MFLKFLLPLFALSALGGLVNSRTPAQVNVDHSVTIEDSGNGWYLADSEYASTKSFVYTAVANFENGQACGMVIGGQYNSHYWVFNVDRNENRTKLLYFTNNNDAEEVRNEYFIGNDKTTESEFNMIRPKVSGCNQYNFKVVLTIDGEHAYAEFFIDNIKRFGVDETIDLNTVLSGKTYEGGKVGFNVFNARVTFNEINFGNSDYAYYTEPYRNQYHYSQYAHWNNDPNGLVYYDGWYHMFYQTHPFSQYWDHMYWGHARSRDLLHWQELPICLFPDDGNMGKGLGAGYAWSGIAMVYRPGMSDLIDSYNWFPNGSGTGLLGYFTRDGEKQDQIVISSDDGGMTWTKQHLISQHLIFSDHKIDCRDPSIFAVKKTGGHVDMWGMVLSGATTDRYWFLKSTDMINWELAGTQYYVYPECMTVSKMVADDSSEHSVISVSSRYYTVGDFVYNDVTGDIDFILPDGRNIRDVSQSEAFKPMEYGEDSYAAQCFYIDDNTSDYYGKNISVSWASGLPSDAESGAYAQVRKPWNGGGMTIPVELGLTKVSENNYALTQTPITKNNTHLDKQSLVNIVGQSFNNEGNPFEDVNSHLLEIEATFENPNEESVEFKVNIGSDEYTSFGWTKTEGYFFDRTHTSKAGINFEKNYAHRFTTGPVGGTHLSFYVLVDNGTLELFCDNFKYAFYNQTLAAPYSAGASLQTSGEITISSLKTSQISSVWHDIDDLDKGVLYLDRDNLDLDMTLNDSKEILAYSSNDSAINWALTSGEGVVSVTKTKKGALIQALANGDAVITVTSGDNEKTINVHVDNAEVDCDYELEKDDVYSGEWLTTSKGLIGRQNSGDGFIISDKVGGDFTYSATFNVENAAAAGLLVRASKDMSSYIMANYDKSAHECKIWSPNGLIASQAVSGDVNNKSVSLSVKAIDRDIELYFNGSLIISARTKEADPLTGYYGLNVFNGEVIYTNVSVLRSEYDFENKDLEIDAGVSQYIKGVYNVTEKNTLVDRSYYHMNGDKLVIHKEYIQLLKEHTTYTFFVEGEKTTFLVKVVIDTIQRELTIEDRVINEGESVSVFLGAFQLESLTINGVAATKEQYEVNGKVLRIFAKSFKLGENIVVVNGVSFKVTVNSLLENTDTTQNGSNKLQTIQNNIVVITTITSIVVATSLIGIAILIMKRRKGNR